MTENDESFGPGRELYGFVALAALPLIAMIGPWLQGYQPTRDLFIAFGLLLIGNYVVFAFRLWLSRQGIRYRSPFSRHALVAWSSITKVRTGTRSGYPRRYPPYFMEIHILGESAPMVINIKIFSRKALVRLATLIRERASQADIDSGTEHLAGGKVPSLLFGPRA